MLWSQRVEIQVVDGRIFVLVMSKMCLYIAHSQGLKIPCGHGIKVPEKEIRNFNPERASRSHL
jgi:hypothetical protein